MAVQADAATVPIGVDDSAPVAVPRKILYVVTGAPAVFGGQVNVTEWALCAPRNCRLPRAAQRSTILNKECGIDC